MPFYIRKSVSVGPFRFNLSKSGIGVSAGVRGFRVGSGPRGNYIHVGRGGLYYRASLGPTKHASQPLNVPGPLTQSTVDFREVETGNILDMNDSNAKELLAQINEKLHSLPAYPFISVIALAAFIAATNWLPDLLWLSVSIAALGLFFTLLTWYWDHIRRSVVLMYDLEADAQEAYGDLVKAYDRLSAAQAKWVIQAQGSQPDWKRNAGAGYDVKRTNAIFSYKPPSVIRTNIDVPSIIGGRQNLYFFPDLLLVSEGRALAAIDYGNIEVAWASTSFIERGSVPRDAQLVRYTWRYVNKNGGPDRRFKNNRQIPVMRYQEMYIRSVSGLNKQLHLSRDESRADLSTSIKRLGQITKR
jgi:hypothetical protein